MKTVDKLRVYMYNEREEEYPTIYSVIVEHLSTKALILLQILLSICM